MQNAFEKLVSKTEENLHICVGLDTDIKKIPKHLLNSTNPVYEFNKIIIENTVHDAAAYKINFAFYEKDGIEGLETLQKTISLIPKDVLVIGDAKRGDIGNTSKMYAEAIYDYYKFDSVTLHPYMGYDSVSPFLEYTDKINFMLALTSNPGAEDFEKQKLADGKFLYQKVIENVTKWNDRKNCGIVFGATNLNELEENLKIIQNLPILLPGIGAQGGDLKKIVEIFKKSSFSVYLLNVSRALLYADDTKLFHKKVREVISGYNRIVVEM